MNTKALFGLALLAAPCLVSCSVEDQELPAEELYARQFYKEFGLVDKNQDWNVVEQKSLTFDVANPTHVKIYELQGDEYRLAADYENVTNGQTITFDGMEGDDESFIVSLDGIVMTAKNGETVSLKTSASGIRRTSVIPKDDSQVSITDSYKEISLLTTQDDVMNNLGKDGESHIKALQQSDILMQKSVSPYHTYYPVYWNSKNKHEVGIFYYDNQVVKTIPVYKDHEGDELQYYFKPNEGTSGEEGFKSVTSDKCTSLDGYTVDWTKGVQAKGFKVQLNTEGQLYGIYVKIGEKTYYSLASLNDDKKPHFAYHSYRSTDGETMNTYIMFDDPSENGGDGDGDYNDLVLYVPEKLSPISEQEIGWTVACEDLGGTYDFDFNDLVFRVYHTSGYEYLTIVPVAAGGTLPAYLQFSSTDGIAAFNEWHTYFGNGYDSGTMINTSSLTETNNNTIIVLNGVGKSFSMTTLANKSSEAGGLSVEVVQKNGSTGGTTSHVIYGADPNNPTATPQMLVLPLNWKWPKELVHIKNVYTGNGTIPSFMDWVSDKNKTKWTNYNNGDVLYFEGTNYIKVDYHKVGEIDEFPVHGGTDTK